MKCLNEKETWHNDLKMPVEEIYRKLIRRGFLEADLSITEAGKRILECSPREEVPVSVTKSKVLGMGNFEEFWTTFPTTDKFAHYGQTRVLRADKPRSGLYYNRVIAEGKITHEQLLNCLKKDIEMRQRASLGGKQNEFKYMPSIGA